MLSTDILLRDGRYRIGHAISSGVSGAVYTAQDQLSHLHVAIVEIKPGENKKFENSIDLHHDGLVRIDDSFVENGHFYAVTEAIKEVQVEAEFADVPNEIDSLVIFERLGTILHGLRALRSEFPSMGPVEILPENIIKTAEDKLKLLSVEPGVLFARNPQDSPYLPFERVWTELDLISQRAFYREFDDATLEALEAPPDASSDLYSLGAVFYKLLTGRPPLTAFERSFEKLQAKADSLVAPATLNPAVNADCSVYILRLLELKRENRFSSINEAIRHLPVSSPQPDLNKPMIKTENDDLDLLEIPTEPSLEHHDAPLNTNGNGNGATAPVLDKLAALSEMEVTPEASAQTDDLHSFVEQFYVTSVPHHAYRHADDRDAAPAKIDAAKPPAPESTVPEPATPEPLTTQTVKPVEIALDSDPAPEKSGSSKLIGLAVAGILVVGLVGWGLLSMTSSEAPQGSTSIEPPAAVIQQPSQQPSASTEPAEEPVSTAAEPNSVVAPSADDPADPRPNASKTRPQSAELKKPAETKPAAKPEQKPKKKMTVDDLLN